jgi:O-antigen/teichoic acid export membrane protein
LQIIEYASVLVSGFTGVLFARTTVLYAKGDLAGLRRAYLVSLKVASSIVTFVLANILWLGVPFLSLWVGPEFGRPVRWVVVWLSLATFLHVFTTLAALPFYHSMQMLGRPVRVLTMEAILNLALSITLARRLGITGVALATFIPAVVSFALLPRMLARALSVGATTWLRAAMVPALALAIGISASQWLLSFVIDTSSFGALFVRAVGTLPVGIAVVHAIATSEERTEVYRRLRRIIRPWASDGTSAPS